MAASDTQVGGDQDIAKAAHHLQKLLEVIAEDSPEVLRPAQPSVMPIMAPRPLPSSPVAPPG